MKKKILLVAMFLLVIMGTIFSGCERKQVNETEYVLYKEAISQGFEGSLEDWKNPKNINIRATNAYIQWKGQEETRYHWKNLIALKDFILLDTLQNRTAYEWYCISFPEYTKSEEIFKKEVLSGVLERNSSYVDVVIEAVEGTKNEENTIQIEYGASIDLPNPTKEGYTFTGWYIVDEDTNEEIPFEEGMTIDVNSTIIAKWNPKTYYIFFYVDQNVYAYTDVIYQQNINLPEMEKLSLHGSFMGWYDVQGVRYTNPTTIHHNMDLFAEYTYIWNKENILGVSNIEDKDCYTVESTETSLVLSQYITLGMDIEKVEIQSENGIYHSISDKIQFSSDEAFITLILTDKEGRSFTEEFYIRIHL